MQQVVTIGVESRREVSKINIIQIFKSSFLTWVISTTPAVDVGVENPTKKAFGVEK